MGFAFWRRKDEDARGAAADPAEPDPTELDPAQLARVRARRRLIGAAALLLGAVVVVPLLLDREPRAVPDNIVIDIPSEKSRFAPKLSVPPAPVPDSAALVPPPDAAPASGKTDGAAAPAKADASKPEPAKPAVKPEPAKPEPAKAAAKPDEARKSTEARPEAAKLADKPADKPAVAAKAGDKPADKPPASTKGGKFAVQVAAPASEAAARELQDKLKKQGYGVFLEKVDTKEGARWRVRTGPYATREEAEAARARLKAAGLAGNLVTP
jgi:DedD protein